MDEIDETPTFDKNDPLNLFPGLPTKEIDPLGLPIPAPLTPPGAAGSTTTNRDQSSSTAAGEEPTTTDGDQPSDAAMAKLEQAVEAGENYIDRVEEAMDEETCEMCRAILDKLRERPLEEQVQGVRELGELKHAAQQGADPVELAEVMEDFEVVDDPMNMV